MKMIKNVLHYWAKRKSEVFRKACVNPEQVYQRTWERFSSFPIFSEIYKKSGSQSFTELRKLPFTDAQDYQDSFQESLTTGINPYNNEKIHFWTCSTGTSKIPRVFPISKSVEKSTRSLLWYRPSQLITRFNILMGEPEVIFVMPGEEKTFAPTVKMGEVGYYLYQKIPRLLNSKFLFSKELYRSEKAFNEWHVLATLLSDLTGISTTIPTRLLHFFNQINENRDSLIQQIKTNSYPKELINKPSKKRIDFILNQLNNPLIRVKDYWPSLRFIACWKSGESCSRQFEELNKCFDLEGITCIDQIYGSTETPFNLPFLDEIGGPVLPFGPILEFIDEEQNVFWPWELEKGKLYEIVVTNSMGLARYKMYDKILCTGHYEKMAKIAFHSRSYAEISLGWTIISEESLVKALQKSLIYYFSNLYFALNDSGNGLVLVSTDETIEKLIPVIDESIKEANESYGKQMKQGNVTPLAFEKKSFKEFELVMLKNPNTKRLLMK